MSASLSHVPVHVTSERAWLGTFVRRAMQERKGRRALWRACLIIDCGVALVLVVVMIVALVVWPVQTHTTQWFERWSDWHARSNCSPRLREQLGRGGARMRRGEAPTRAVLWH